MSDHLVLAHHIVYSAYGFWLPNDPRGLWSTYVGSQRLFELFGPATKVTTRESLARAPHDYKRRLAAKSELNFPPAKFNGRQALEVALAVRDLTVDRGLVVLAYAVLPEHAHLVACRHALSPAKIVGQCRARASRRLHDARLWPKSRPIWGRGKWAVELNTPAEIWSRIEYVNRNPEEADLPPQTWSFITPYTD